MGALARHRVVSHLDLLLVLVDDVSQVVVALVGLLASCSKLPHFFDLVVKDLVLCIFYVVNVLHELVVVAEHLVVPGEDERLLRVQVVIGEVDVVSPEVSLLRVEAIVALSGLRLIH